MEIRLAKPAARWGEALPAGNGHIGGMVYSGIGKDRIDLSENTFFSGDKSLCNNQKGAFQAFLAMREKITEDDYEGAVRASDTFIGVRGNYGTNLPVGSFYVDCGHDMKKAQNYSRLLRVLDGVIESEYQYEGARIHRTVFVSHLYKVMVYRVAADSGKLLNLKAGLIGANTAFQVKAAEHGLDFFAYARENIHSDGKTGVNLCGHVSVMTDGQEEISDCIHVHGASEVVFFIGMVTDFNETGRPGQMHGNLFRNFAVQREEGLPGWLKMRDQHIKEINKYMKRVNLEIQGTDNHAEAVSLIPLMFQYGRYLLLSSSREDSRLPAHLQGIWNDNVACRIGWTCDMHLDINTQMNYWPSEVTNLSETVTPLFRWIEEELVPSGRITARESYGKSGWVAEIVSNAWGYSAPYWASPISPCPTGGVWILTHMWEHYLSTGDADFLKYHAYDVIKESARFFSDYVFEDPSNGLLTCGPSISPENAFVADGKKYHSSCGCTYEMLMIRELFSIFLEASRILRIEDDLTAKTRAQANRLLPYRITVDGKIAEWNHDYPSSDLQHRHTSHLLGLFPFSQITPEKTPELAEAACGSIHEKLIPLENWEDTGWARSLLTLYTSRLGDGESAFGHISSMLEHLLEGNFMIIHPPTRGAGSFDNVYELDGNTGLTAGIAEMLLQSHDGVIRLLPALPSKWVSGQVAGLIARGGIEVDLAWKDGKLLHAGFLSQTNTTCTVKYMNETRILTLRSNKRILL